MILQSITVPSVDISYIRLYDKRAIFIKGHFDIKLGPLELISIEDIGDDHEREFVDVAIVTHKKLKNVSSSDYLHAMFKDRAAFMSSLRERYPSVLGEDTLTIISFFRWDEQNSKHNL